MSEVKNIPRLRFPEFHDLWTRQNLDSLSSRIGDGLHGTPNYVENSEYYFINGNNLSNGSISVDVNTKKVSESDFNKNDKGLCERSLLISLNGTIGSISRYNKEKVMLGKSVGYINFVQEPNFYFFQLQTSKIQNHFISELTGSTIKNLSLKTLRRTNLSIPSLPEQQKIADFLTAVDKRIELLEKKKTLLETYKKGVIKKIFNQEIRFKDDNGNDFPDWEEKKVKDVFRITRGNVLSVNQMTEIENFEFKYPVYSSQTKNKGVVGYYNEFLFQDSLTWTTDGANAGEVNFRKGKFYCTNVCGVLISEDGSANECTSNLINSISKRYVSYVGNPKLMNGVMAEIKLTFPSVREQLKISKFLVSIDIQIELLETQIDKSKTWKRGLLQKMFV